MVFLMYAQGKITPLDSSLLLRVAGGDLMFLFPMSQKVDTKEDATNS